ncbi:hypothetical protein KFE96_06620 [Kordiimonas sp. SCSIO 12603]|uniref:ubiquitin-like domain-containing protein n=1 Tax=Kordiimonas sp. SCSIO 12603 TaxID=2829596 RepID=UPI0021033B4E|nr:ubiquitin-like domain-containing protein [Kordiimonas sp. SCSIO 12603]UTW59974.1 hypothetical protein KFE96_06620 [Kordiimonas sp. SCSIO 12603]
MKKFLNAFLVGGLLISSTAAFAGKVTLTVEFDRAKIKFRQIDTEVTPVCTFKRMVAERLNIKMKEFNLRRSGSLLRADNMLSDHRIHSGSIIKVEKVSYSSQCR